MNRDRNIKEQTLCRSLIDEFVVLNLVTCNFVKYFFKYV